MHFPALLFATQRRLPASHRLGAGIAAASILAVLFFGRLPAAVARQRGRARLSRPGPEAEGRRGGAGGRGDREWLAPGSIHEAARLLVDPGSALNRERTRVCGARNPALRARSVDRVGLHDLREPYARVMSLGEAPQGHMQSVPVTVAASAGIRACSRWAGSGAGAVRGALPRRARGLPVGFERDVVEGPRRDSSRFLAAGLIDWNLGDSEILTLLMFLIGVAIAAGQVGPPGRRRGAGRDVTRLVRPDPTLNEADNLPECLAGCAFADEIVVVDSGARIARSRSRALPERSSSTSASRVTRSRRTGSRARRARLGASSSTRASA